MERNTVHGPPLAGPATPRRTRPARARTTTALCSSANGSYPHCRTLPFRRGRGWTTGAARPVGSPAGFLLANLPPRAPPPWLDEKPRDRCGDARPGRSRRVLPALQPVRSMIACRSLTASTLPERTCSATGGTGTGSCGTAGNLQTKRRTGGGVLSGRRIAGQPGRQRLCAAGQRGGAARDARIPPLLGARGGWATRAPVAYRFTTGQWAPHGEQTRAFVKL